MFFSEPIGHELHMLIEERLIVCAIGVTYDCVFGYDRVNFADGHGAQQTVTNRLPFTIWVEWWNNQDVCHLRESFVTLNHLRDVIEVRFVEIFAHRALARCRRRTGDAARETLQFSSEIFCTF